ncbi:MAG: regulatory protein GemA [Sphingopyxis sp.]|uniref:regulatory protein GemA n=1 Tax=Sphingopyxis sp. TaxID=1908224 RepID=UPI003D80DC3C
MNPAIKMIHVAKRDVGIEDSDYRAMLERVTGTASLREMSDRQHQAVIGELKRMGFQAKPRAGKLAGPYGAKLNALWLSGWNLGVVTNRSEDALIAFVERQTGIAHVNWVRDRADAMKAIEALKKWIAREGGVVWPPYTADPRPLKLAVIAAQHRLLGFGGPYVDDLTNSLAQLDAIIAGLGEQIRAQG